MNRRAAAAHARRLHNRGARTGYTHRLLAAHGALGDQLRGRVAHAVIEHDGWCDIYRGSSCNCLPNISVHPCDGGDVIVVDRDGQTRQQRRN